MADKTEALSKFLQGFLGGTAELGLSLLPLVAVYKDAKKDPNWREEGIKEWMLSDPAALTLLENAFKRARSRMSAESRALLIMALGGTPGE